MAMVENEIQNHSYHETIASEIQNRCNFCPANIAFSSSILFLHLLSSWFTDSHSISHFFVLLLTFVLCFDCYLALCLFCVYSYNGSMYFSIFYALILLEYHSNPVFLIHNFILSNCLPNKYVCLLYKNSELDSFRTSKNIENRNEKRSAANSKNTFGEPKMAISQKIQ